MTKLMTKIREFLRDESGLTMTEYAVAGGVVTLGCVLAFQYLSGEIDTSIRAIGGYMNP